MSAPGEGNAPVPEARQRLAERGPVLVIDEFRRVGIVGVDASAVTPELTNFLTSACRGILYVAVPRERLEVLGIPRQPRSASGPNNLHLPVDARHGTTTGISAHDRTRTIETLVASGKGADALLHPGHVTPVALDPEGTLSRPGLPEALRELAPESSAGVAFCAVLDDEGDMANVNVLRTFAATHDLPMITISDVVRDRRRRTGWASSVSALDRFDLPLLNVRVAVRAHGAGALHEHVPVSIHELCPLGLLRVADCKCQARLNAALARLSTLKVGAVALWWRADGPSTDAMHETPAFLAGLRNLVAARVAGGVAAPFDELQA